jgi:UDP-N-acetylglucosamine--N-acetylmuramyl-(pentapeptide) pyrophosphoryl-undecaprenol N-acetylglucosamine transferase
MRIVLVGGGTGGHFYPLIAVAEALRAHSAENLSLYYFGPEPYAPEALAKLSITYISCPAGKRRKYRSWRNITDSVKLLMGILVATWKLFFIYPDVVFSKGGYTSVPVVLAAAFLRIPIVIHESDAVPGSANRLATRFARYIAINYDDAAAHFPAHKVAKIGIPIRRDFFTSLAQPHAVLGIPNDRPVLFITGGSLGAERINTTILDSLDELLPHYTVVHQAGAGNAEAVTRTALARSLPPELLARYFVLGHVDAAMMAAAYQAAAMVVSRAGSTSIVEIALMGKPSIIIPIPEEVSHDQRTNAYAYARTGAASVIEEKNLTDGLLSTEINRILSDQATYRTMAEAARGFTRSDAASTLASTLMGIAAEHA